ncbi:MAG: DNA replication protein [Alphaproteobacteria bacterium]|nr:DNA replication protein [Alphaproteobacteria bacterium]
MPSAEQLLLDLGHRTALGRDDFLIAPGNEDAVAWVDLWPEWPAPALVLHGPAASGKSHLAAVWKDAAAARWLKACELSGMNADEISSRDDGHLVIDALDPWIGNEDVERTLFHLYNIFRDRKRSMLVTMRAAPVRQPFVIRDLASRLRAAPAAGIHAPDDVLLSAVLVKMFADRQLRVSDDVLTYVLPRMERSFAAARDLVERADRLALQQKRAISVPLMRMAMAGFDDQDSGGDGSGELL